MNINLTKTTIGRQHCLEKIERSPLFDRTVLLVVLIILIFGSTDLRAQDANNPIDPSPTGGLWNRFYGEDQSRLQFLTNLTYGNWFYRFTAEAEFNYNNNPNDSRFSGANFLVARLFKSKNGLHHFGIGGVVSYYHKSRWAGGVNFVSVSKFGDWKVITLTTLQGGKDIFTMEFQPGLYHDFENGWYFRSHPRMLFDFENEQHEIPIGAGVGKILDTNGPVINLFFEPQYDLHNKLPMLYTGIKMLF
ncbi:hypothetical protein N6H18_16400 [Reichenbachiella agarivorans]|uniref:Outer membrane protein beta-barrel domain-containing protein n=1 Tax=Reichenbachiella agarivorans TaxID=2979464 RepID=A0ABY6CN31_9BACT|nr:hypothetical protein [Reichenbachiella agarivorans]UXP31927.1 hypothetical protein N6H18_16400 [Reichenbachiella agarivorans]